MMLQIEALGPDGPYKTRARGTVADAAGNPALEISLVPSLVASHWIDSMREAAIPCVAETVELLSTAADIFQREELLGDSLHAYEHRVSALTGTPIAVVRQCTELIAARLRDGARGARLARPAGSQAPDLVWREQPCRGAAWCRVGDVFAVNAAGNSPGVHAMWIEALALGYRVAVRPSTREPLTPGRLIGALRCAGMPGHQAIMVPTDHAAADAVIGRADVTLLYGGQDVVDRYHNRSDVLTQGPGRSKLVVAAGADRRAALDLATEGALYHAGTACTSTTAVCVEDDPGGFAGALAQGMRDIEPACPWDDRARLPCMPEQDAQALVDGVLTAVDPGAVRLAPTVRHVGSEGSMSAVTPAVVELGSPSDPLLSRELPFPCVWVAPFHRDAIESLSDSLVLAMLTDADELVDRALELPAVANVYVGRPTSWAHPDVPHDGFLGEFLMRSKGFAHVAA
jgi:acyl-CoA reductase-like NAD-dependent aldehyde dehydrogenase